MKLTVNLGANSYPIYIENNILSQADTYIHETFRGHKIMIISDDHRVSDLRRGFDRQTC